MLRLGTVTGTSPLQVREDNTTQPVDAKVAGGLSLTPSVDDRVLLGFTATGRLYILGAA